MGMVPLTVVILMIAIGAYKERDIIKKSEARPEWEKDVQERRKKERTNHEKEHKLTVAEFSDRFESTYKGSLTASFIFTLIFAAVIAGGYVWSLNHSEFLQKAITAEGTITAYERKNSTDTINDMYYPSVSFTDTDGRTVTFQSDIGSSHPTQSVGDNVDVLFLKNNPSKAIIDRGIFNSVPPLLAMIAGLIMFIFALRTTIGVMRAKTLYMNYKTGVTS